MSNAQPTVDYKVKHYKMRNNTKISIRINQNVFAKQERETLINARHNITIEYMVIIVNIISALFLIREAMYELNQINV